jgi:hypothetical protein
VVESPFKLQVSTGKHPVIQTRISRGGW